MVDPFLQAPEFSSWFLNQRYRPWSSTLKYNSGSTSFDHLLTNQLLPTKFHLGTLESIHCSQGHQMTSPRHHLIGHFFLYFEKPVGLLHYSKEAHHFWRHHLSTFLMKPNQDLEDKSGHFLSHLCPW